MSEIKSQQDIEQALNDPNSMRRHRALRSRHATPKQVERGCADPDPSVRRVAVLHKEATPELVARALGDDAASVTRAAARSPQMTMELVASALTNEDAIVRRNAVCHHPGLAKQLGRSDRSRALLLCGDDITARLLLEGLVLTDSETVAFRMAQPHLCHLP